MSQVLTTPWLSGLFKQGIPLDVDHYKLGRRVQMFHFVRHPPPGEKSDSGAARGGKEPYPVTCEISDKHNFIRAAITKRSLRGFENAREQPIETMGGMVVNIDAFRLMLYDGEAAEPPDSGDRRKSKKHPGKSPISTCPKRIRDAGKPQFWIVITKFSYLGAEGNAIFDEPRYILTEPCVRERMAELLAERQGGAAAGIRGPPADNESANMQAETTSDKPEKRKAAEDAPPPLASSGDRPVATPKRQRPAVESSSPPFSSPVAPMLLACPLYGSQGTSVVQSSAGSGAQWPTIEQIPFASDAQAAWACAGLWQAVGIQRMCIPHMPIHGMRHPQPASWHAPAKGAPAAAGLPAEGVPVTSRPAAEGGPVTRALARSSGSAQASVCGKGASGPPSGASRVCQGSPHHLASRVGAASAMAPQPRPAVDNLHGLLVPGDAGLVPSEAMMDALFGSIVCGSEPGNEYDVGRRSSDGIDAAQLLSREMSSTQERGGLCMAGAFARSDTGRGSPDGAVDF